MSGEEILLLVKMTIIAHLVTLVMLAQQRALIEWSPRDLCSDGVGVQSRSWLMTKGMGTIGGRAPQEYLLLAVGWSRTILQ